ncbi:MAG: amidohydrolase family protein [Pseudohongiellaceae bacterium]
MKQTIRSLSACLFLVWPARRIRAALLQLLILTVPLSQSGLGQEIAPRGLLLDNVRVIVGDGSVLEQAALLIIADRIASVGMRSEMQLGDGVEIVDLTGKTLIPALIDGHAHLGYEAQTSWGAANYTRANLTDHLQRYAYYGFAAVFSAGSDPDELAYEVQQAQLRGEFDAARLLFAAGMGPPGEGPNDQFLAHALTVEQRTGQRILYGVADVDQAIASVRVIAAKNIPIIKIWVDDRGGSQQKLSPLLYRAIAQEAAAHGIEVYAHQQNASDMPGLLEAGIAGFLHGRIGSDLGPGIAGQLAEADAFVIPNMGLAELRREAIGVDPFLQVSIPSSVSARLGESEQRQLSPDRLEAREAELRLSFAHLLAANVDIVLGTDAGAVPDHFFGYTGHRELEIFVRLGMTPMQAIMAGTSKPAQRFALDDLGLLKEGFNASVVVLEANPLEDIRNTRSIESVYLNGKPLDRARLATAFSD